LVEFFAQANYRRERTITGKPQESWTHTKLLKGPLIYSLFIYQDENEDEGENQSFRSFLYVLKQTCDERTNNSM